jgi:transposase-like protein
LICGLVGRDGLTVKEPVITTTCSDEFRADVVALIRNALAQRQVRENLSVSKSTLSKWEQDADLSNIENETQSPQMMYLLVNPLSLRIPNLGVSGF